MLGFGTVVILLACALTLLASPWVDLSLWKIFRRCASIAAALATWLFIRRFRGLTFRAYGLTPLAQGRPQFFLGAGLGLAALAILLMMGQVSGACHIDIHPDSFKLWRTLIGFIPAAFLVSILEELVFRGLILRELLAAPPPGPVEPQSSRSGRNVRPTGVGPLRSAIPAIIISSGLYAAVHLRSPGMTASTWMELGGLFLLGAVLAISCLKTGSLWSAIGLHSVLAYGARVNKLIIAIPDSSWGWLTGTSRLINGLAAWGLILIAGWIIWNWSQKQGGGSDAQLT